MESSDSQESSPIDEIKRYYDYRYVSACEESKRIYDFDIHLK